MKTQFTITVNEDVKKKFQALTKKLGTNASTVINMYLVKVINTGEIDYYKQDEPVEMSFIPWDEMTDSQKKAYKRVGDADPSTFINI